MLLSSVYGSVGVSRGSPALSPPQGRSGTACDRMGANTAGRTQELEPSIGKGGEEREREKQREEHGVSSIKRGKR